MHRVRKHAPYLILCVAFACADPNRPDPVEVQENVEITANLHGNSFHAISASMGTMQNGVLTFGAVQSLGSGRARRVTISLSQVAGPGSYYSTGGSASYVEYTDGLNISVSYVYTSNLPGGNATIILTTLTATRAVGSFSGTLRPVLSTGASEDREVSGSFDVVIGG
jgi:hypothetical protein